MSRPQKSSPTNMSSGNQMDINHVTIEEPVKEIANATISPKASQRSRSKSRGPVEPPVPESGNTSTLANTETISVAPTATVTATVTQEAVPEPILQENPYRHTIFPLQYPKLFAKYKNHLAVFWTPEEIDLSKDMQHWAKLNKDEQHFIKHILGFFAGSDGIVMENLSDRFSKDVQIPEARFFYAAQNMIESIHCVAPETKILTDNGYMDIVEAVNTTVNVWNGEKFSPVNVVQTSPKDHLYKVTLNNGMTLDCTDGHKWLVRVGPRNHAERCKVERIETKNLKTDDIIEHWDLPTLNTLPDPDEFKNPYTHGFFCGDGTYCNNYPQISLYGVKQKLIDHLVVSSKSEEVHNDRTRCYITNCINKPKFYVPINYSLDTKLRWLEGYVDADGCINESKAGNTSIQVACVNLDFLKDVQLLLTTLGINTNIKFNRAAGEYDLPDGHGGLKKYYCNEVHTLYITGSHVSKLVGLGFQPKRLKINVGDISSFPKLIKVVKVEDTGRDSPTYCFNEPERHCGTFNGIVTGQSETYSLLIDTYIDDPQEKIDILRAVNTIPCVKKKAEWAQQWITSADDFATRLLAFAAVEGIFFSGAFCAIYWIKERGIMPGLTFSNELIARDEGLHTDFAVELYKELKNRLSKDKVHKIIREAVKAEKEFITKALPCDMIGMNSKMMSQYIEFVADRLVSQLGYPKIWYSKNPFDFMERISLESKENFFEKRVSTYAKATVGRDRQEMKFTTDADF